MSWEGILDKITRSIFGLICHQDRSILMKVAGREISLCPRCMGLHMGFLSSFIAITLATRSRIKLMEKTTLLIIAAALGSMAVDWGLGGYLGLFAPTLFSRLVTGLASGSALGILLVAYRRGIALPMDASTVSLTGLQTGGLICFSLCIGTAAVLFGSWGFLSSILLLSVIANASLAMHTVTLIVRSRWSLRTITESFTSNKGGLL